MKHKKKMKDKIKRCMATGKVVNGRQVILADLDIIKQYLIQNGYNVYLVRKHKIEILGVFLLGLLAVNLLILLL